MAGNISTVVTIVMDVIKASTSNYGETLDYLDKIERDALIDREMSNAFGTDKEKPEEMSILRLRKKHPDFTLPPIEVGTSSAQDPVPYYRCPYCGALLHDTGDLLRCKNCPDRSWNK